MKDRSSWSSGLPPSRRVPSLAFVTLAFAATWSACGSPTPTMPASSSAPQAGPSSTTGSVGTQNNPPILNLKTTPAADRTGAVWTLTGLVPLSVEFNTCTSSDPDQIISPDGRQQPPGDFLNWQFNYGEPINYTIGDDGTPTPDPASNPDGSFRADFGGFCRIEHTYEVPGTYIATVSVTDQHLEDQAHDVTTLARRNQRVRIVALAEQPTPSFSASWACASANSVRVSWQDALPGEAVTILFVDVLGSTFGGGGSGPSGSQLFTLVGYNPQSGTVKTAGGSLVNLSGPLAGCS